MALRTPTVLDAVRATAGGSDLFVGAGTVPTAGQVDQAVRAGRFIVSPGFSSTVVRHCQQLGVPVLLGAARPTEIQMAIDADLDMVEFFPLNSPAAPQRSGRWPDRTRQ
jgi:2-dehydro-3-deoxyphosphogluconate aldolase/(4S)-4-hydroxy-2-oxoglutarate aldolase